uniref:TF_AP-2 domain-containing protein n=1 Tax=Panagrellus redivivus TaxID=6233 RepID=A0A7E4UYC0_PANRE
MQVADAQNGARPAPQIDLVQVLRAAYPDQFALNRLGAPMLPPYPALTVATEPPFEHVDVMTTKTEEVMKSPGQATSSTSSSPRGSAARSDSPASTVGSLPKESENSERKRPAAIQELLQSKKARLDKIKTSEQPSPAASVSEGSPGPEPSESGPVPLNDVISRLARGDEDDSETTSSGGSVNGAPPSSHAFSPGIQTPESSALLLAFQKQMLNDQKFGLTPHIRIPSSANDNGVLEHPINSYIPVDRTFAQVPGRLSLLSNVVKYKMTVGEVRRRLMGPEAFNFSLLGALLRRAKMPEKSHQLVEELASVGLSIARGRRRMSQVTLLSALTESESVQFAKDFQQITDKEFPVKQMAEKASKDHFTSRVNAIEMPNPIALAVERRRQLEATRDTVIEFIKLLNMDRSPVCETNSTPVLEPSIQDPLSTYSMLTHGFGTPAVLVGMTTFINFINSQIETLTVAKPL